MAATLGWVGRSCTGRRSRWVVRGVAAIVVALGVQQAVKLAIGYTEPGSPLLWPISNFNRSSSCINATYGGCNDLVIYMQGDRDDFGGRRHSVVVDTQLRFSAEMAPVAGLIDDYAGAGDLFDCAAEICRAHRRRRGHRR